MTEMSVNNAKRIEDARANRAREGEMNRSNLENERERRVDNARRDRTTKRGQNMQLIGTGISTLGKIASGFIPKPVPGANLGGHLSNKMNFGRANDPAWYNQYPELVRDAANVSFNTPAGPNGVTFANIQERLPGVMNLYFIPAIGDDDAINIVAKDLYAYVRHVNSGARNYEASDLMEYILAVDSIYTGIAFLVKCLELATEYNARNWAEGSYLLDTLNIDKADISKNLANYRLQLNFLIARMDKLNVPSIMHLFSRHLWMAGSTFKDSAIAKSQLYQFVPEKILKLDEGWSTGNAYSLTTVKFVNLTSNSKLQDLIDILDGALSILLRNSDIGIMSGDILKAYPESSLFKYSMIPAELHHEFVYSEEVLTQICGASITPIDTWTLKQDTTDTSLLKSEYASKSTFTSYGASTSSQRKIINAFTDNPTPDDIMVATRLSATWTESVSPEGGITFTDVAFGTEAVTALGIWCMNKQNNKYIHIDGVTLPLIIDSLCFQDAGGDTGIGYLEATQLIKILLAMGPFDWAPRLRIMTYSSSSHTAVCYGLTGDFDNYAEVEARTLINMHRVAILSELGSADSKVTSKS